MPDYEIVKTLGEGAFGLVRLARDRSNNGLVAIKTMKQTEHSQPVQDLFRHEIDILRKVDHVNIVRLLAYKFTDDTATIVLEYCPQGDLRLLIDEAIFQKSVIHQSKIVDIVGQVLMGLHHCHHPTSTGQIILHRDLKPENLLLDKNGIVKLADFGLGKLLFQKDQKTESFVGTPGYLSPEVVSGEPYGPKADIYSFGCIIFELLMLRLPSENKKGPSRGLDLLLPPDCDASLSELVMSMLSRAPSRRPSSTDMLAMSAFASWTHAGRISSVDIGQGEMHVQNLSTRVQKLEDEKQVLEKKVNELAQKAREYRNWEKRLEAREASLEAQFKRLAFRKSASPGSPGLP